MLTSEVSEQLLMLPWDAVGKVTAYDYLRKSRYFLEHAGYIDPKAMHHKSGPGQGAKLGEAVWVWICTLNRAGPGGPTK